MKIQDKSNSGYKGILLVLLTRFRLSFTIIFILTGIASTIWFLIKVIPKPIRATYPCMQAAAPVMSGFIVWLLGLSASALAFRKAKILFRRARLLPAAVLVSIALVFCLMLSLQTYKQSSALPVISQAVHEANNPTGEAQGIFPGRVVWAWDPAATNENQLRFENGDGYINEKDDYYFLIKNNDQSVIDTMMADLVLNLGGGSGLEASWDALFKYHNKKKSGSEKSYSPGEKIFIKINATSILTEGGQTWDTWMTDSIKKYKPNWWNEPDVVETSPQIVLSVIRQLINEAGVQQEDIYIGDPIKNIYQHLFNMWKNEFPNINILGNDILYTDAKEKRPLNLAATGRIPVVPSAEDLIFYSDKGTVMDEAVSDKLYTIYENADYLINIASLKAHACAGITLCTKNHFGSHTRSSASHLHKGLIGEENDAPYRTSYGMYRVHVDLMGHELLGGNTMLCIVDGLYSAQEGWTQAQPIKWRMTPFNNDYTNSIFASQDPVALESVCFDFLRNEYNGTDGRTNRPNFGAVDDYLHQAADSANWPEGILYDPENDGTIIESLGTHEHWNDPQKKQYSRNLGIDYGIELFAPGLVNNIPKLVRKPGDVVMHKNSKPVYLIHDLRDVFSDSDGDDLTFTVSSSNSDEVDAIIDGDTAVIIQSGNNFTGFSEITVTASDGTDEISEIIRVKIADETQMTAIRTNETIVFDGIAEETIWENSRWYYIDQVWIPYRADMTADDFSGRYKVAWSEDSNLLYFYAETTDDVFVDGYVYNSNPSTGGNYPSYDILEIFIDEDKSGGKHVFDDGTDWGTNAENAFSYHYAISQPADGETTSSVVACDIAGTSWGSYTIPDYADHLGNFIVRRDGNILSWEFSLKVYNDTYDDVNPENSRVILAIGKQIGLSLAYCDNDDPNEEPKTRDNFIGSDVGPDQQLTEWNEHWMNASVYGNLKLDDDQPNRPPEVTGSINDLQIYELNNPYIAIANLNEIFLDPDGDQLIFSGLTDDPALTVDVQNDTVVIVTLLNFLASGMVTIMANDGDYYVSTQFTVNGIIDKVKELSAEHYIDIRPNPFNSNLSIKLDNNILGLVEIQVMDLSGKLIVKKLEFKVSQIEEYSVDLSDLDPGIYLIHVKQGLFRTTKKIVHQ
jgi:hypothetical protein